jgi:uncharacterized membrane protein
MGRPDGHRVRAGGSGWQREIHQLMGVEPPPRLGYVTVLLVAALLAAGLVGLFRLLRRAAQRLAGFLGRWIPPAAARVLAGAVVLLLALGVLNGVVIDGFFTLTDNAFRTGNDETQPDTTPPDDPLRSGGPGSLVSWQSLGNRPGTATSTATPW